MAHHFEGDFTVATSREEAFAVLSRVEAFAPVMPSYVSHTVRDDGSADVKVKVGVGKVRGTGKVNLQLKEKNEPINAKYVGKGEVMGGAFNLEAAFELEELAAERTRVKWEGDLSIFGKLVSLAGGLVKPVAQRDIQKMVQALQQEMGGAEEVEAEPAAVEPRPGVFARFLAWLKRLFGGSADSGNDASKSESSDAPSDQGK